MKIAHVADSVEVGGAEVMIATLARIQHAAGHQVSIHCLYAEGALADQLRADGIPVYVDGPDTAAATTRRLYRSLREDVPDVAHCHNAAATIYGASVARFLGVPTIVATRHSLADRRLFRQEVKFWIAARLFCKAVVVVSEAVRRSMESHTLAAPGKLVLIRNGAATLNAPAAESRDDNALVLVNVARLTVLKDHLTLLRAAAIAKKTVPDLKLWIVGDGEQRDSLRAFVRDGAMEDWVCLFGEQRDVGAYLARANAFILSSISEGLPISLLEAMASGLPAISTQVGGIPEVAALSGACQLVPPSDPEALAEAICRLAGNRRQLSDLGARARRCYESYFTPERMAGEYMQMYRGERPEAPAPCGTRKLAHKEGCQ